MQLFSIHAGCSALWFTAALAVAATPLLSTAEELTGAVESRHGAVPGWHHVEVESGVTVVGQDTSDSDADAQLTASFDLVATIHAGAGRFVIYVEGDTSPSRSGVASVFPSANADAGTALDRDGNGRLQVSELHYIRSLNSHGVVVIGLLDPTTSLDTSHVANDETSQFLNTSLVNNPSIEFPDYTLGAIYNHKFTDATALTFMLTGSNGLADNPDASYAQLMDVTDDGKGVFAATELQWLIDRYALRTGVWLNSADHARLDGDGDAENNYGAYAVIDGDIAAAAWSVRLGLANEAVSQTAGFASVALEYPLAGFALGAGVTHSWLSDDETAPELDDSTQAEIYARFEPRDDISLTPSLQWLKNSGFDASDTLVDDSAFVYSLRLNMLL